MVFNNNLNEVYADCPRVEPAHGNTQERFLMGWTMAGGGQGQNIHNNYHKDAHFAYFYPSTDTFANAEGDDLGDAIIGSFCPERCSVDDQVVPAAIKIKGCKTSIDKKLICQVCIVLWYVVISL